MGKGKKNPKQYKDKLSPIKAALQGIDPDAERAFSRAMLPTLGDVVTITNIGQAVYTGTGNGGQNTFLTWDAHKVIREITVHRDQVTKRSNLGTYELGRSNSEFYTPEARGAYIERERQMRQLTMPEKKRELEEAHA